MNPPPMAPANITFRICCPEHIVWRPRKPASKVIKPDVVLHVQDNVEINFELGIGAASESVQIQLGTKLIW
jgi:hypothetical protein